jgi:uncharacterized protein
VQAALESAIAELVLGPELDLGRPELVHAWLARHGVEADDARAIESEGIERWLTYRRLVRHTLREALELAMPRAIARLGARFDHYFARFLAERGPQSHALRGVKQEFLDWCEKEWRFDAEVPAYLPELARHESLQIEIGSLPAAPHPGEPQALELDRGVALTEAMRIVHYRHKVHELGESLDDRSVPEAADTHLLVYRSPEHEVRYLELTPLAAGILERLSRGRNLRHALREACEDADVPLESGVLEGSARLLSDLATRGVLLGAKS